MSKPKKKPHPCRGCHYWKGRSDDVKTCNYYLWTDHRRPCPPGEGCTVRVEQDPTKRRRYVTYDNP